MLDRLRERLEAYFELVGRTFSRVRSSPTGWTLVGLALSGISGIVFWNLSSGGQLAGGALILAAGWFDIVDGAVARVTGKASKRGAFLDSTLDRVAELFIFLGIFAGGLAPPIFVFSALSLSLLVSYTRAKGDALGIKLSGVGIGERSERLLILGIASLAGHCGWGIILVALVAGYTFLERTLKGIKFLDQLP